MINRPKFIKIPCGKVLGHGECCCEGHLCSQCSYISELEAAQQNVQADELSGHAKNCVLRSGGYACTCGAAEPSAKTS